MSSSKPCPFLLLKILEKYSSCILARPEVFRRPWDSVVQPDGIFTPGEKFFLVTRTVKKLQRRIRKPDREVYVYNIPFVSKTPIDVSVGKFSCKREDFSSKSFFQQSDANESTEKSASCSSAFKKKTAVKKHPSFPEDDPWNKSSNSSSHGVERRPGNSPAVWKLQPSLAAICERTDE